MCVFRYSSLLFAAAVLVEAQAPSVAQNAVLNAASYASPGSPGSVVAPGSIVSIFGGNLAPESATASSLPLPTSLAGVSVTFNGKPAPLLFVSPGQLNVQLPWSLLPEGANGGLASLVVSHGGRSSPPLDVRLARFSPGVFTLSGTGLGPAVAVNANDGSLCQPVGSVRGMTARPARSRQTILIYANGLGPVDASPKDGDASLDMLRRNTNSPVVLIGGQEAEVQFSGLAPQFPGINQLNVLVPARVQSGDAISVQLLAGGVMTNDKTTIAVEGPDPAAAAVWDYLQIQKYRQSWQLWPGKGQLYQGSAPHGAFLTTYVNDRALRAITGKAGSMPPGSMVLKENYMPDKTLAALTLMYKSGGFDSKHNDWYWSEWLADGTLVVDGKAQDCLGCHERAEANDYIFTGSLK